MMKHPWLNSPWVILPVLTLVIFSAQSIVMLIIHTSDVLGKIKQLAKG